MAGVGTDNPRFRSALAHALHRRPVLPVYWATGGRCACGLADCPSPAKHPISHLVPNGVRHATTSLVVIRAWWANAPLANPALAIGEPSGIVVLDVDGDEGRASLDELEHELGALPLTQRVRTGSGEHLYLQYPRFHLKNTASKLGPGLDVRCCGGYVVTVGAVHRSGHAYVWKAGHRPGQAPIAEMPLWLTERLTLGYPQQLIRPAGLHKGYASAALASEETQLLQTPIGNRNARLNLAAFRLARFIATGALGRHDVEDVLFDAATRLGLSEREARATILSGIRASMSRELSNTHR
jgi:hypothetical protein